MRYVYYLLGGKKQTKKNKKQGTSINKNLVSFNLVHKVSPTLNTNIVKPKVHFVAEGCIQRKTTVC